MKLLAILLISAVLLSACNVSFDSGSAASAKVTAGTAAQEQVVAKVAAHFLRQLDAGNGGATWANTSPYLQQRSTKAAWVATIQALRGTVGPVKSRKIKGFGFTHSLKSVPKGNYVAVAFETTFTNTTAQEKVVLHNDHDSWKVMGYFLSKKFKIGRQRASDT